MWEKLKLWLSDDEPYYAVLVFLVGVTAFGLGLLSGSSSAPNDQAAAVYLPADVTPPEPEVASDGLRTNGADTPAAVTPTVVASENGTRYHLPTCPGAGQIHEENRIEFPTIAAASAAGYSPAKNCPGLAGAE